MRRLRELWSGFNVQDASCIASGKWCTATLVLCATSQSTFSTGISLRRCSLVRYLFAARPFLGGPASFDGVGLDYSFRIGPTLVLSDVLSMPDFVSLANVVEKKRHALA